MTMLIDRLKAARRVSAPLIAIETADAAATIKLVVEGLNGGTAAVVWDVANGMLALNDEGQDAMQKVDAPQTEMSEFGCVRPAEAIKEDGILFAHWDRKFWESPPTVQQIWNLRDKFKADHRTLILLDRSFTIPDKLQGEIVILEDPLPGAEQINRVLDRVIETHNKNAAEARGTSKKKIPDADLDERTRQKCVDMARGMHDGQAELLLQMCLGKDGKMDLTALAERQRKIIEQVQGLTVFRNAGSFADIGGLDALKEYVAMIMKGRNAPKLVVWLDEIGTTGLGSRQDLSGVNNMMEGTLLQFLQDNRVYGILLAGAPGCGKSEFCKSVGGEFDRVVVRLDLDATKGSLVGASEEQLRSALQVIKACADDAGSMLWIATANSIESLSSALRNRFVDCFFFDLPTRQERQPIWKVWLDKMGLDDEPYQDDEGWNGRNVWQAVDKSWRTGLPVADVAKWITPVGITDSDGIESLRKQADGRYLSASQPGLYRRPRATGGGRRVEL